MLAVSVIIRACPYFTCQAIRMLFYVSLQVTSFSSASHKALFHVSALPQPGPTHSKDKHSCFLGMDRRDRRFDDRRDARDPRERSPGRGTRNYRDDRGRYDDRRHDERRESRHWGPSRGYGVYGTGGAQTAPILPDRPPVNDKAGALLPVQKIAPAGTVGEPTTVLVNHYTVISLPTVKVYEYEITMEIAPTEARPEPKLSKGTKAKVYNLGRSSL